MKFKLDDNLPVDAPEALTAAGHDAHTVLQEDLGGKPDETISETCKAEHRILVTLDTDFCNILAYPPVNHAGIIVIRSLDQSKEAILSCIRQVATAIETENVDGIRIR